MIACGRRVDWAAGLVASAVAPGLSIFSASSISSRASPMSWTRAFGSRSRQRCTRRRMVKGVSGGNALQSGTVCRMAASTSDSLCAVERPLAREHLEENHTKGPDIGSPCHLGTTGLLRTHVGDSSDATCRGGSPWPSACRSTWIGAFTRKCLRDAEIKDFHGAVRSHFDVGWLQVPVNDAFLMGGFERISDLARDRQCFIDRHRTAFCDQLAVNTVTADQFHDQGMRCQSVFPRNRRSAAMWGLFSDASVLCFALEPRHVGRGR